MFNRNLLERLFSIQASHYTVSHHYYVAMAVDRQCPALILCITKWRLQIFTIRAFMVAIFHIVFHIVFQAILIILLPNTQK